MSPYRTPAERPECPCTAFRPVVRGTETVWVCVDCGALDEAEVLKPARFQPQGDTSNAMFLWGMAKFAFWYGGGWLVPTLLLIWAIKSC